MSNDSNLAKVSTAELSGAVLAIKTAILQSQGRAARGVNQEQLALYYGIGRFISVNTRKQNWGAGFIDGISERLKAELPGLRGFSGTSLRNMRTFYEAWYNLEVNSTVQTDELSKDTESGVLPVKTDDLPCEDNSAVQIAEIRQLQLANLPYVEYIMQDYRQPMGVATYRTAEEMEPEVLNVLPPKAELEKILEC